MYRFSDFVLCKQRRLLTRSGVPIRVSTKQFDCLVHFVENTGKAIPRDDLIMAVWRHTDISDNQVAQLICSLRRLLGSSQSEGCIRTVPGYGYEWTVEVHRDEETALPFAQSAPAAEPCDDQALPTPNERRAPAQRRSPLTAVSALFLLVLVCCAFAWKIAGDARPRLTPQPPAPAAGIAELTEMLRREEFAEIERSIASLTETEYRSEEIQLFLLDFDIARKRFEAAARRLASMQSETEAASTISARLPLREATLCAFSRTVCTDLDEKLNRAVDAAAGITPHDASQPLAHALLFRATMLGARGEQNRARVDILRAKHILAEHEDPWLMVSADLQLARTWMMEGRFETAEAALLEAAEASKKLRYPRLTRRALIRAARTQGAMLKWREGLENIDRAIAIDDGVDRKRLFQLRAFFLQRLGRTREAMMALETAQSGPDSRSPGLLLTASRFALGRREYDLAASQAALAFSEFGAKDEPDILFDSRSGAMLVLLSAQLESPSRLRVEIPEDFESTLRADDSVPGLIAKGHRARLSGQPQTARTLYRNALRLAFEERNTFAIAEATKAAVALAVSEEEPDEASELVASLDAWDPRAWRRDISMCADFRSLLRNDFDPLGHCDPKGWPGASSELAQAQITR